MARRRVSRAVAAAAAFVSATSTSDGNCFVLLPEASTPFSDDAVADLWRHFAKNLNVDGTGAVIASPGDTPALPGDVGSMGYSFDWMRDGALAMVALQRMGNSYFAHLDLEPELTHSFVRQTLRSYARWVHGLQTSGIFGGETEPKWEIAEAVPWVGGWCRPQTDGPGLRAYALMMFAKGLAQDEDIEFLWRLVKHDLDWLASDEALLESCDLWEETTDPDFLWNRASMRSALLVGQSFAMEMGDPDRAYTYLEAAEQGIGDPLSNHVREEPAGRGFITQCPSSGGGSSCQQYDKGVDGAVILTLIHGVDLTLPTSAMVARTVAEYNRVFCGIYAVNREDTERGIPGVLYGRYAKDEYGGGNPWVLITAALASLLYEAANVVRDGHELSGEEVFAWQGAFASDAFQGSWKEFVAAGDSVLQRLQHHVELPGDWHLYEQLDKATGEQYNARDLTWSYAEVLEALVRRRRAVGWRSVGLGPREGDDTQALTEGAQRLTDDMAPQRSLVVEASKQELPSDPQAYAYHAPIVLDESQGQPPPPAIFGRIAIGPTHILVLAAVVSLTAATLVGSSGVCRRSTSLRVEPAAGAAGGLEAESAPLQCFSGRTRSPTLQSHSPRAYP